MLDWLKIKLATVFGGKTDDFKKDERGHAICNHRDVDDRLNEPEDFAAPPLRLPTDRKEKAKLLHDLKGMRDDPAKN